MKIGVIEEEVLNDEVHEKASAKLYDLSMVEAISGGDKSFINKMLHLFIQTVPGTLKEMSAAAAAGEWLTLSKLAHKLKSTIDSMGIADLKQDVRTVEANAKSAQSIEELPFLVKKINEVMQDVIKQVKRDHSL